MGLAANYAGRVGLAAWRRKSALLGATGILMLLLVALQYHQAAGPAAPAVAAPLPVAAAAQAMDSDLDNSRRNNVLRDDIGSDSVKFLQSDSKGEVIPEEANKENVVIHLPADQPSRDEIAVRQESLQRYNGGEGASGGVVVDEARARGPVYGAAVAQSPDHHQPYVPPQRLAHFDLKGAPPKVGFLKKMFALLEKVGTTGVLLEWEDMFPFSGKLAGIAAGNAYSRQDVHDILQAAKEHNLEVIPLVQTFGHVEFALKLEQWASLREVPESPQALCPSLNSSMDFIKAMIDQVMELHPGIRYLHIGCDEVFQMGECSRCRVVQRDKLFLSHVANVASFVRKKYIHAPTNQPVIPIIWHDMLLHFSSQTMEEYRIGELVEPMVWVYAEDVYRFVPTAVWDKFAGVFPKVWAASAFKGAFGETLYIPNIKRHLENNLRWLEVMAAEGPKFKGGFQGIAVTGWQRYDHFAVLCELLPAAVPSLVINMLTVGHGFMNASLRNKINQALGCLNSGAGGGGSSSASTTRYGTINALHFLNLNSDPFLWDMFSRCFFPGMPFYKLTYRLNSAEREVQDFLDSVTKDKGWMTDYNVRRNFTSPLRVDELMMEHSRVYHSMASLARAASEALSDVFDAYTIAEWVEQRIYPDVVRLERVQNYALQLKSRRVWPRRPLPPLIDLKRLGVALPGDEESSSTPGPHAHGPGPQGPGP